MSASHNARIVKLLVIPVALLLAISPTQAAADGPLTPEQALASFQLDPGLKIECVAAEPMVESPVAVAWDEAGRMYVVEDRVVTPSARAREKNQPGEWCGWKVPAMMVTTTNAPFLPTA